MEFPSLFLAILKSNLQLLGVLAQPVKEACSNSGCCSQGKSWKHLQTHLMSHSSHRPYKCKICDKGFKEAQKLERHQVTHTKEKKFKCQYCDKTFGLKHNMKSHQKVHEGNF